MPLYKFGPNDIFDNQLKTHPKQEFYIYEQCVYHNNRPNLSNAFADINYSADAAATLRHVPCGYTSLYELNVGRPTSSVTPATSDIDPAADYLIYPFITKEGFQTSFKTISTHDFYADEYGDVLTGSYPLSASLHKEFFKFDHVRANRETFWFGSDPPGKISDNLTETSTKLPAEYTKTKFGNKIEALQNALNSYAHLSPHYLYSTTSLQPNMVKSVQKFPSYVNWNKSEQEIGLLSIPSIFYGSSIRKGELVQVGPTGSSNSGSVAGVVLYNEGFIILTGTWNVAESDFTTGSITEAYVGGNALHPRWTYFAQTLSGAYGDEKGTIGTPSSSYFLGFEGTQYVPVKTMLTHAPKGELNFSNNPTYIEYGQVSASVSSSTTYVERKEMRTKNIFRSPYPDATSSFRKQTYISKIGIYDERRNLIGIAKLATPVKKTEDRDYTFKLKLDF